MKYNIDEAFVDICKQIVMENNSLEEWNEIRSDDMFQDEKYCGGFESIEDEFTFSVFEHDGTEYWFEITLEDIKAVVEGKLKTIEVRFAGK